ncbi:19807_t:CDS:2, partial [Racocetra fulgida]
NEILREVAWVIFDEIHYMRDKDFRPTPLQHYVFPDGAEGIYLVVDENGRFREDNFQQAVANLEQPPNSFPPSAHMSKKEEEKELIKKVIDNAIELLSEEDRDLPWFQNLLPLLRRGIGVHHSEYMLEHSFYQFQNAAPIPRLKEEKECSMIEIPQEEVVSQYHNLRLLQGEFEKQVRDIIFKPEHCLTYLNRGRLVKVKFNEEITYKIKVLVKVTRDSFSSYDGVDLDVKPCPPNEQGVCMIVPVGLGDLQILSQFRFKSNVDDLEHDVTQRNSVYKSVLRLISEEPDGRPMDPQEHLNIKDDRLYGILQLNHNPTTNSPEIYESYLKKLKIRDRIQLIQKQLRESELILHLDELKRRKRLLRRLGYLSSNDIVEFKGRVACELTSGDELVLTELLLNGVFNELSVPMTAAMLSCFVCDEIPSEPTGMLPQEYNVLFRKVQETAKIIADVTEECNIPIDKDVYLASFSPALMEECNI